MNELKTGEVLEMELLRADEIALLDALDVEMTPIGMTFRRRLDETEMRTAGWAVVSLKKRTSTPNDPAVEFAFGDWITKTDEWFGDGSSYRWLAQLEVLHEYKEHLLKLIGATMIQLQSLEYLVNICCSFLSLEFNGPPLRTCDLLHPDLKHRTKTIGTLRRALADSGKFQGGFVSQGEESRLGKLVEDRNRFIHHFWVDTFKANSSAAVPSIETLHEIDQFVSRLLKDASELEAPFRGLFYSIGKQLAGKSNKMDDFDRGFFAKWSEYEPELHSVLSRSDEE